MYWFAKQCMYRSDQCMSDQSVLLTPIVSNVVNAPRFPVMNE
jgi:hypothetical protein